MSRKLLTSEGLNTKNKDDAWPVESMGAKLSVNIVTWLDSNH